MQQTTAARSDRIETKAAQFGIEAFRSGDEYLATLHVGWAAHQGRLLVSQDGVFATFGMPLRQPVNSPAPSLEVDEPRTR